MNFSRPFGALLLIAIAATGCDDPLRPDRVDATADPHAADGAIGFTGSEGPDLISNRIRYRDTGWRPTTGRTGAAYLQARALLASDGSATLDVTTGDFNGWWSSGTLTNVQVKLLDDEGEAIWSRAHQSPDTSMASYALPGAGAGTAVRVQGTIQEIGSARTGVVSLTEIVRRRPDLAVTALMLPERTRLRAPTLVEAVVEERNGEMGAEATCAAYVDGTRQDWMPWIWVDAGGAVTCAFAVVFREPGTRTVRVVVEDVNPGDWDQSNNAMEGTVEVEDRVEFDWWAGAFADVDPFSFSWRSEFRVTDAAGMVLYEEAYLDEASGQTQHAYVNGWMPARVSFPLDAIYLGQETGGRVLHSQTLTDLEPSWRWEDEYFAEACISGWGRSPTVGYLYLLLCSGYARMPDGTLDEWTWVDYGRNAGEVTYHSEGYSRYFDEVTGEEFYYSWNYDDSWSEPGLVPYGPDYTLDVRVTDRGSEYPIHAVVPLMEDIREWDEPYTCFDWTDEWDGLTFHSCFGAREYSHTLFGWASNTVF